MGAIKMYEDLTYYQSGIYRQATGKLPGGHAVAIVGFDYAEQFWLIQNSWGSSWGDNGYARIGYGEVQIDGTYPIYAPEIEVL